MRIVFTGGGSGGHFFPIIAIIKELKRIAEEERIIDCELFYLGPDTFGKDLLREEGITTIPIESGKIRTYFSFRNVLDVFKTGVSILRALWNIFLIMPDVIFSKGGYGAFPAVIAAAVFRIPLIIHESDTIPGRVNQFAARFADRIGITFASSAEFFPKEKTALIGFPIRTRILGAPTEEAKEAFDIFSDRPVVGCIGASQGSEKLNDAILEILKELTDEFEVVHQTGTASFKTAKEEGGVVVEFGHKERYHPIAFLDESGIRNFYAVSTIIVSRAGASSIFEIAAWGKPSILIPLAIAAQDHQRKNAYEYATTGAAVVIEESNLTPHILLAEIKKLAADTEKRNNMSQAAQRFARIDGAELIAREILKLGVH